MVDRPVAGSTFMLGVITTAVKKRMDRQRIRFNFIVIAKNTEATNYSLAPNQKCTSSKVHSNKVNDI